jgi:ribonuclease III
VPQSGHTFIQTLLRHLRRVWRRPPAEPPAPPVSQERLEAVIGTPVGDLALFERALRHRSMLRGQFDSHLESNERLEFLGDAVLGLAVAERLYAHFPSENEGFLTRVRAQIVNGVSLSGYATAIGLHELVLMSDNMIQAGGRSNQTILADAFEAVIGAIYLDQGFDASRAFVFRVLDELVDLDALSETRANYKSTLLEYVQSHGWPQPQYRVIAEEGPSHDRVFTVEVVIRDSAYGRGTARSKKQAEQLAAEETLRHLKAQFEDVAMG